jgi:hypothetical protein
MAVGAAKGIGSFAYNTVKTAVALGQGPVAGAVTMMTPGPKALAPSNQTQAEVSAATQVGLTIASVVAPLALEASAASTALAVTSGTRYVGAGEAALIEEAGMIPNTNAAGALKYLFYTPEEPMSSASGAQAAYNLGTTPSSVVTFDAPGLTNIYGGNVEGGTGIELIAQPTQPIPATSITPLKQ